ncbi:MAG: anthranilate phosphoribosyltransferase [Verrucomicrobiae bacterium]|nr:anthranilate phosphoribosyltransferase [Verrucomicrobiae bacterium]
MTKFPFACPDGGNAFQSAAVLTAQTQLRLLSQHAAEGQDLSAVEIEQAIHDLLEPGVSVEEKAEFLLCLARKGESPREIADFAILLRDLALDPRVDLGVVGGLLMDTCGTGADNTATFNVSTAVAFVLAASDVPVAKHGNRAITSRCGSADVLEALGVNIEMPPSATRESIERLKFGFLFAPLYHKTFKALQPVRQFLARHGKRTIFNLLGPLVNPARPNVQIVGVYDPALTDLYVHVLYLMKLKRALVVHGYDGMGKTCLDELSTLGKTKISQLHSNGNVETFEMDAATLGLRGPNLKELQGGDAALNARIIRNLLSGDDDGPRRDFLLYNAAAGFVLAGKARDLADGMRKSLEILESGAALARLDAYRAFSQTVARRSRVISTK